MIPYRYLFIIHLLRFLKCAIIIIVEDLIMNELRKKRTEMGITQVEAANICGVSRRTYQYYKDEENNKIIADLLASLIRSEDEYLNVKKIKDKCQPVFKKYPEIRCAYLYGSYARGQATKKSDVDILVVCPAMGMKFYGVASELEEALGKDVDLQTHRQILENAEFIEKLLCEGIKIYG